VYTLNTAVLSRLHREEAQQDSNVLLNMIASATVDDTDTTAATVARADIKLLPYNGKRHCSPLNTFRTTCSTKRRVAALDLTLCYS
jgi:hypothetical protein